MDEHGSFWTAFIDQLPRRPGTYQQRDDYAAVAGVLRSLRVTDDSVVRLLCQATGLQADTFRAYGTLRALEELRANADPDAPPLPRIYASGENKPALSWVNLPEHEGPLAPGAANLLEAIYRRHPHLTWLR